MNRLLASLVLGTALATAAVAQQPEPAVLPILYLQLADDPRYSEDHAYARIQLRPLDRPYPGAEVAIEEAESIGKVIGVRYELDRAEAADAAGLADAARAAAASGTHFILLDAPGDVIGEVAAALRDESLVLFNVTAPDDELRGAACQPNLLHTIPSHAMQADALVQFAVARKWRKLLVLRGPLPEDAAFVEALKRSAKRFGARIEDVLPFELSNNPRNREENNIALLTAGGDYDLVVVADSDGEFGRYVPYATNRPRPVAGTTGLVPDTWNWAWERHGAPQLNSRFERTAERRMTGQDWATWVAVKSVVQASLRTKSTDFKPLFDYMRGDRMRLDGFKGPALSFRPWDNQLRQPILLATHNAVIERAPIEGFLHETDNLDTLGPDIKDTTCRMERPS